MSFLLKSISSHLSAKQLVKLTLFDGAGAEDVTADFKFRHNVVAYWYTPVFDMGTNIYSKTLYSMTIQKLDQEAVNLWSKGQSLDEVIKRKQELVPDAKYEYSESYSPNVDITKLEFKPTTNKLTVEQNKAKELFGYFNKSNRGLVFTDELGDGVNGAYKDGVIYISTKADAAQEVLKHELAHDAEGTKAYNKFAKYVLNTLADNPEIAKTFKGETLLQSIERTSELYQNVMAGKDLTQQQVKC